MSGGTATHTCTLVAHVQPRARTTEVVGWHGDAVKVRVRCAPADGAANNELVRFLAGRLGVGVHAVSIVAGATARRKHVRVDGLSRAEAISLLGLETGPQ